MANTVSMYWKLADVVANINAKAASESIHMVSCIFIFFTFFTILVACVTSTFKATLATLTQGLVQCARVLIYLILTCSSERRDRVDNMVRFY